MSEQVRYTLIGTPFSTFTRTVAMALQAKDLEYEQIECLPHSTLAETHSPLGFIPIIYDNLHSIKLIESTAILHYLQRQHPTTGPNLFLPTFFLPPSGTSEFPQERIDELVSFAASQIYPKVEFGIVKPVLSFSSQPSPTPQETEIHSTSLQSNLKSLSTLLTILEKILEQGSLGPYAIGSSLTAADCMLFPPLADLMALEIEGEILKGFIRVKAWLDFFSETEVARGTKKGTLENGDRP